MAEYVSPPLETDPTALGDESVAELQAQVPDWEPSPANLETILIYCLAVMVAELRDVSSAVFTSIFRYLGAWLVNLPPDDDAPASVTSTWTAIDDQGYTIGAGSTVGIRAAGDDLVLFDVETDVVIPAGSTATAAGAVTLVAQEDGAAGNNLGGAGAAGEPIDAELAWVDTIVLTNVTGGGLDAEEDEPYLNRLTTELQLQSPTPILPRDFAVLYQRQAEVDRALAIDLYKPADQPVLGDPEDVNRPRSVTVVGITAEGEPVSGAAKAAGLALLQSMRETTFEVWAIDPTYTTIDVTFDATAYPEWDAVDVEARAIDAVTAWLSPANWGQPQFTDDRQWLLDDTVRLGELFEVLNRVDGLWRVDALTFGIGGGALAAVDVALPGTAPLTRAGVITGNVTTAP